MRMQQFNGTFPHLAVSADVTAMMSDEIGQQLVYNVPEEGEARDNFIRKHGTICAEVFTIVGIQKNFEGVLCYRATYAGDEFGRCINPADARLL